MAAAGGPVLGFGDRCGVCAAPAGAGLRGLYAEAGVKASHGGQVWCFGDGSSGQLGLGDWAGRAEACRVEALQAMRKGGRGAEAGGVRTVAAGSFHSLAVGADGTVFLSLRK